MWANRLRVGLFFSLGVIGVSPNAAAGPVAAVPLRVLYAANQTDSFHDFEAILPVIEGDLPKVMPMTVTSVPGNNDDVMDALAKPGFSAGYDVVLYNLCNAREADFDLAANILAETRDRGAPAVALHCTMHTFLTTIGRPFWFGWTGWRLNQAQRKWADTHGSEPFPVWWDLTGGRTWFHDPKRKFVVKNVAPEGDAFETAFPEEVAWASDELYNVTDLVPGAVPVLQARSAFSGVTHPVAWHHTFGKGRVFSTTLGHDAATVARPDYLRLLATALRWAADGRGAQP